jgi:hypothetical protein
MFLPTTRQEMAALGWDALDVILVSGDSYIDSPFIGTAVIGKLLVRAGNRVGVIAQPDVNTEADITRLGEPRLFWGVSAGSIIHGRQPYRTAEASQERRLHQVA